MGDSLLEPLQLSQMKEFQIQNHCEGVARLGELCVVTHKLLISGFHLSRKRSLKSGFPIRSHMGYSILEPLQLSQMKYIPIQNHCAGVAWLGEPACTW